MGEWCSLPLDGLSEWSAGNYGDVPVDAGATTTTVPRPHFSPQVEKYRAQAEQDLGNPSEVDAYLKSLEGGATHEPAPNERERQRRLRIQSQQEADTQAILAQEATNRPPAPVKSLINDSGGVEGNYGPFDTTQGADYVDAPTGSLRAKLEAQRQGKDQLGNAALALATGLPIIGAGPISGPLGVIGGTIGQSVDEKLGLPQVNVPLLGKVGPATLAGGLLGGIGDSGEGIAGGTVRNPVAKARLRVVQPGETPAGAMGITGKTPNWSQIVEQARASGMTDAEINSAFPGAIDAAAGINTGLQTEARTNIEQIAKGAAARRNYNKNYQDYFDNLKGQGFSDGEAADGATTLAAEDARRAAAQAPEVLPGQKPNVPYSEQTASELQQAQEP